MLRPNRTFVQKGGLRLLKTFSKNASTKRTWSLAEKPPWTERRERGYRASFPPKRADGGGEANVIRVSALARTTKFTVLHAGAQRHLAAIVAADVAGYSRLIGLDEEGTVARLKATHREVIAPLIGVRPCRWTASCCGFDQALGVLILKVDGTAVTKR